MGTFRHPLRNDWDRLKPRFEQGALGAGAQAETCRAMLTMVPPLLDVIEAQRDRATPPEQRLAALFAVIAMLLENAIETAYKSPASRRRALDAMLSRFDKTLRPRLSKPSMTAAGGGGLILPGM
jgi:hypothetical protein